MPNGETSLLAKLVLIGALIAMGQLLVSNVRITFRILVGRVILGSATALMAGVALIKFENLNELTIIGIACALGILGSTVIEEFLRRWLEQRLENKKDKES
ncbi:holin [Hafnia paralvei]|uniref:holin n=1 Tax=Hafnia paralvei TaxID=546367 RepID=UPI003CF11892